MEKVLMLIARPKGDGLNNVRSRVDYLKGQLDIQSDSR